MNLKTDEKKVKRLYFSLCLGCVLILAVAVALAMCGFVEIACFLAIMMLFLGICGLVLVAGVKIHAGLCLIGAIAMMNSWSFGSDAWAMSS